MKTDTKAKQPPATNATARTTKPSKVARRRGRPPKNSGSDGPTLSRADIIIHAVKIARKEGIPAISMVRLAKDLGVAPGLIHYYMGSKQDVVSAVMNTAFKERFEAFPTTASDWRKDLEALIRNVVNVMEGWPGLATYLMVHKHFRLFQRVKADELDYGLAYFDHFGKILQQAGFSDKQAAAIYHICNLFILTIAMEREHNQSPDQHSQFIASYIDKFDPAEVPGAIFLAPCFAQLDTHTTFDTILTLLLDGFEKLKPST